MSDPDVARSVARLHTAAVVLATSVIAVPLLVGVLAQALLAQLSPTGLDTTGPGYQLTVGVPFLVAAVVMVIAVLRVFALLAARAGDRSVLRYPILITQLQVGFTIAIIVLLLLTPGL